VATKPGFRVFLCFTLCYGTFCLRMHVYFCCVRFSLSVLCQEIGCKELLLSVSFKCLFHFSLWALFALHNCFHDVVYCFLGKGYGQTHKRSGSFAAETSLSLARSYDEHTLKLALGSAGELDAGMHAFAVFVLLSVTRHTSATAWRG